NQNETGIDCGGICGLCESCYDGIKNQDEEEIDCGGSCPDVCPTCDDGIQNQNETDVDCGGPCDPCDHCFDGILNLGEIGVDCGGPCPACIYFSPCTDSLSDNVVEFDGDVLTLTYVDCTDSFYIQWRGSGNSVSIEFPAKLPPTESRVYQVKGWRPLSDDTHAVIFLWDFLDNWHYPLGEGILYYNIDSGGIRTMEFCNITFFDQIDQIEIPGTSGRIVCD
ncbi:MAG: hypothetical protein IH946_07735, partial [Bacteroidetes bacterium]|nr:hypothetical protein [Bacteroidota bacterium]